MDSNLMRIILDHKDRILELMQFLLIEKVYFYPTEKDRIIEDFAVDGINVFFTTKKNASVADRLTFKQHVFDIFKAAKIPAKIFTINEFTIFSQHSLLGRTPEENLRNYHHVLEAKIDFQDVIKS